MPSRDSILQGVARVSPLIYSVCRFLVWVVYVCTMNLYVVGRRIPDRRGHYILAVTHLSHLEAAFVSLIVRRRVDWVVRIECFCNGFVSWLLRMLGAIKVNRQGVPVSTIRTSLERLRQGRVVGIFPEGGVQRGKASVVHGGPIKLGVSLLACRAQVPIIPVVVLGVHELMRVEPWLPFKRAHIWLAFGEPIQPLDPGRTIAERRVACRELADRLREAMQALHADLCTRYKLGDQTGVTYAEASTASSPEHATSVGKAARPVIDSRESPATAPFAHPSATPG
jgi:1-acyl-sn-glycerol-3-phosphate acyltransferase